MFISKTLPSPLLRIFQKIRFAFIHILVYLAFLSPLTANVTFTLECRKVATIFYIMDNVALHGKHDSCDSNYRPYWDKQFPSSPKDIDFFVQYAEFRIKSYPNSIEAKILFPPKTELNEQDPVSSAFYSSSTFEEVWEKLRNFLLPSDISFLQEFYKHFELRYSSLPSVDALFPNALRLEQEKLTSSDIIDYLKKVTTFYGVDKSIEFTVLHTWFPPIECTSGRALGNYLLLCSHIDRHGDEEQTDIILHEVIHTISENQPEAQKQTLTKAFLDETDEFDLSKLKNPLIILEEPLAVALGQMLYLDLFDSPKFQDCHEKSNWYHNNWINEYAKIIYPRVKQAILGGEVLNETLVRELARRAPLNTLSKEDDHF